MIDIVALFEHIGTADHLIDGSETHLCHAISEFFGEHREVVDDGFRGTGELGA